MSSLLERRWARIVATAALGSAAITLGVAVTSSATTGRLALLALVAVAVLVALLSTDELLARRTRARVTGIEDTATAWRLTHDVNRGRVPVDEAWWPPARLWASHRTRRRNDDRVVLAVFVVLVVVQLVGAVQSGDARSYVLPALIAALVVLAWTARRRTRRNLRTVLEVVGVPEPADAA